MLWQGGDAVKDMVQRAVNQSWAFLLSLGVLALLTLMGMQSTFLAAAAIGMAATLALMVCLGVSVAGTIFLLVAMSVAPLNDLRLGASYVTVYVVFFFI